MSFLKARDIGTNPRSIAGDQSPTIRRLVAERSQRNLSRQLVADQSLTSRRLVGDHLATFATSSRSNSVAASLLCMFKRQLATDFNRRLVGDFKKTFPRPLQPLRDYNFYAPNFEKVGSILVSACPCVRPSVCASVRPFKKNLTLGFRNFIYGFLVKK